MSFNWNMDPLSVVSRYSDKLSYVPFAPESATSIRCHVRSVTPSWKRWCAPFEANEHDEVRSVDFKATRLSSISRDSIYAALNKKPSLFNYVNLRHYRENFLAPALDQNRPQKEGTLGRSSVNESIITYICTYIHTYVCVYIYINVSIRTLLTAGLCAEAGCSETEEKCQALGLEWRAMTEVDSPRSAWDLAAASRVVIYIPAIFLLPTRPPFLWDSTWRMWLPDERKQSSKIYRSYLPTDAGYLSSYQRIPSDPRNSSYPLAIILPFLWSMTNIRVEIVSLTFCENAFRPIERRRDAKKCIVGRLFVANQRLISGKGNQRRVTLFVFPLSVFGGKRVRFSQFAPWPRKIAIGLGNTFTTGPGPGNSITQGFFFFALYFIEIAAFFPPLSESSFLDHSFL